MAQKDQKPTTEAKAKSEATEPKAEAEATERKAAEFSDGATVRAGANFRKRDRTRINKEPGWSYYLAHKDRVDDRIDEGWVIDDSGQRCRLPGHVIMKTPKANAEEYKARVAEMAEINEDAQKPEAVAERNDGRIYKRR